ncbi:MAG: hypothetical protein WA655_11400 [Candidatus Korobacteraceae bacterium]
MHKVQPAVETPTQPADDLSLIRGGLFYRMQRATRLMEEERWLFGRRVILAVAITWLPLLLMTWLFNPHGFPSLLRDYRVYARLLIAVPVLLLGQMVMETRFRMIVSHVMEAGLLDEDGLRQLANVIAHLRRLRDSIIPELIVIVAAYAHTAAIWHSRISVAPDWAVYHSGGAITVTPAGLYFGLISQVFYQILIGLALWKWALWAFFLFRLSRLKLKLVATHPDSHGGLGFLGLSPLGFSPIAFAASAVIGAMWRYQILHNGAHLRDYALSGGVLLAIVILIALGPLAFFIRDLSTLRRRAIFEYGTLAQMHSADFHDKWILHRKGREEEFLTAPESSSLADFGTSYENIEEMVPFPLDKGAIFGLAVAVLLPMLPAVLAEMPLSEVLKDLLEAVK